YRGDYERVIELAHDNLTALPADRIHEDFGTVSPPHVHARYWLTRTFCELGRFAESATSTAEALRFAESRPDAHPIGIARLGVGMHYLLKGDWVEALSAFEQLILELRTRNFPAILHGALAHSAWSLAQLGEASQALDRLTEAQRLLEPSEARGYIGD